MKRKCSESPAKPAPWPSLLWIVRHGQSAGNVARDVADENGLNRIELTHRDVDVPLSDLGRAQSRALGHWFASFDAIMRPEIMLFSPYLRAVETAQLFRASGGYLPEERICIDERLREKEFGILDGLTMAGVARYQPEQAEFRNLLGKFYHRPPWWRKLGRRDLPIARHVGHRVAPLWRSAGPDRGAPSRCLVSTLHH